MTKAEQKAAERAEAMASLRDNYGLAPGKRVMTIYRHGGDTIRCLSTIVLENAYAYNVSGLVAKVTGDTLHIPGDHLGVKVHGGGMDMGADLVMRLSEALFGNAYALKHDWL